MLRAAQIAGVARDDRMQDWPIEVSDPARLDEFVDLLITNKTDPELTYWLLDLVLESANDDLPEQAEPLVDALVAVGNAAGAPAIAERLEYWARLDASGSDEMFRVTPLVREARRRIGHATVRP